MYLTSICLCLCLRHCLCLVFDVSCLAMYSVAMTTVEKVGLVQSGADIATTSLGSQESQEVSLPSLRPPPPPPLDLDALLPKSAAEVTVERAVELLKAARAQERLRKKRVRE